MFESNVVVVGGGIAGMAAALALGRAQTPLAITLFEQAPALSEVGAGIQLGPNATRVLHEWGLQEALEEVCAFPPSLYARDMSSGNVLGQLELGDRAVQRYGAPYATIHRADLHRLLHQSAMASGRVQCHLAHSLEQFKAEPDGVSMTTQNGLAWQAQVALACDGVWSRMRSQVLPQDKPVLFTGHVAYRGMVRMSALPQHLRHIHVQVWLGHRTHAVLYPVKSGEWLNVVIVVQRHGQHVEAGWDHAADAQAVAQAMGGKLHRELNDILRAVGQWRMWPLYARKPVWGHGDMARGRVAFLGDAAHPMKPYLAQGAAMALEDAWLLGAMVQSLPSGSAEGLPWPQLLRSWGQQRWARAAWVQRRSNRNGFIFHLRPPFKWVRNLGMRLLGSGVMDVPKLYKGPPAAKKLAK